MKKFDLGKFLFYVFSPLLLGTIIGFFTKDDFSYLESLNRTIIVPPIVFIVVWSILYVLMGVWYYLYEKDDNKSEIIPTLYWISLFVNLMFTPILFKFGNIWLAFIDVVILLVLIAYIFIDGLKNRKKYSFLLLPYILWLFVALTLTIDLLIHN